MCDRVSDRHPSGPLSPSSEHINLRSLLAAEPNQRQLTVRVRFAAFLPESAAGVRGVVAFLAPFLACGVPLAVVVVAVAVAPAVVRTSPSSSVAACVSAVVGVYEAWPGVGVRRGRERAKRERQSKVKREIVLTFAVRNGISDTSMPCGGLQQEARVAVL